MVFEHLTNFKKLLCLLGVGPPDRGLFLRPWL